MRSTQVLNLLVAALSGFSVAQATFVDANFHGLIGKEIAAGKDVANKRAEDATGDISSTPGPAASSSTTTSGSGRTSTTGSTSSTTSTPPPTSTSSSSTTPPPTTSSTPSSTSSSSTPTSSPTSSESTSSSSASESKSTITIVTTATNSDGSPTTYTTMSTSSTTPDLANSGSNQTSGMSPTTRNTVIGVVVGVGGAIVLAGIALVAWRIWGRKKNQEDVDDVATYNSGYTPVDKTEQGSSVSGRSPFQSTLESYHAPTQVNQASNF